MHAPATSWTLDHQHIVLHDISWKFYEQLLAEIGDRSIRVTYDQGTIEIMSPLFKHEFFGAWIGRLIELICTDRSIAVTSAGSTTFRIKAKKKGLEPDECYYIQHAAEALKIEGEFNPAMHPVPDLAVEIDITSRSVPREPIYAALGVPELWRFDGTRLHVLHLSKKKTYVPRTDSLCLPFLPIAEFTTFISRIREKDQIRVLREFRAWIAKLPS